MKRFSYLTFDCYGTLIDWRRGIELSLARALGALPVRRDALMAAYVAAENRHEGTYKKYREVLSATALDLARELGVEVSREAAATFASSVPEWPAFNDTAKALRALGRKGYKRYILSNVDEDLLRGTIRRNGLEVDGFVTAEETKSYKPSHGHWNRFLEKTGAPRERVLHVAQSVFHDIVPVSTLGIASAWVNRYREALRQDVRPLYICDSLASLVDLLE